MADQIPNMDYDADEVIENFKSKFKWPSKDEVEVVVKPPKLGMKILLSCLVTIVISAVAYYAIYPAFNFKSGDLYTFIIGVIIVFCMSFFVLIGARTKIERKEYAKKQAKYPIIIVGVLIVVVIVGYLAGATLFRAKSYSELMPVESSDFSKDFEQIKYDEVPRLDSATAKILADQKLGKLDKYKSQYVVTENSTQINYKGRPVRVAYFEYANVLKWLNNTKNGLPAYMLIDLVTQEVEPIDCMEKFGEGIKYSPTELFNEKLLRHLRFQFPTAILDTPNFEIDDNARPYWITPVLDKTIGLFGGTDVKGVIITDALNGESKYYSIDTVKTDKTLNWIDVVYNENLVIQQYNYHGKLSGGFWNSIIFQNDVNIASNGVGNIALDDDVWVYTGITSTESDSSNFGFILCNQRTKETRYYKNGGATEFSAVESAKGAVQNYGYQAIFPILLDIEGQPTYFMSLYDDSYNIKGYALVKLDDKTVVGTGLVDVEKTDVKALNAAVENYINALKDKGMVDADADADDYKVDESKDGSKDKTTPDANDQKDDSKDGDSLSVKGEITDIKTTVNDGNTVYYLQVDGKYYYIKAADAMNVILLEKGDTVTITYEKEADNFIPAKSVE
ncbi:MAG: CvpA family protein [Eubacterium sp.]|nr:CvpA family protein [Eubacterium sp.]MBR1532099.1 CvpA family protein [Eubacterium sp.]